MSTTNTNIQTLFDAGVHFGYPRARRHPTASAYLYTTKDRTDIFDLIKTEACLTAATEALAAFAQQGKTVLFVGGKPEAVQVTKEAALRIGAPFVAGRWIGGTLTNFKNIRKRIERMEKLVADRDSGEMEKKYTKREQLLLEREIEGLEFRFGGIASMTDLPAALVIVDTRHEKTAVQEANQLKIPVFGLSSSDCDFSKIQFPVPANDTSIKSLRLILGELTQAISDGRRAPAHSK